MMPSIIPKNSGLIEEILAIVPNHPPKNCRVEEGPIEEEGYLGL
jgi:hypothetical protein